MLLRAYSLLDMKAGAFTPPFFMAHDAQAIRAAVELAQDRNTTVGRYPSDFALCAVGCFDDASGSFVVEGMRNLGVVAGLMPAPSRPMPLFETGKPNGASRSGHLVEGDHHEAPTEGVR